MGGADAGVVAVRRDGGHARRGMGGRRVQRVVRLDPQSGAITEYLLPSFTNIRRVFVDSSTTPATFWVGNNHGASIVKLEALD